MTAAAPVAPGMTYTAVVGIGGVDYAARIPEEYRPGSWALEGVNFAPAVAASLLGNLATQLTRNDAAAEAVAFRAMGILLGTVERDAIALRLATIGDPLTLGVLRAGLLEAVKALAVVTPRPAILGGKGPSTVVTIAGREYTAVVPPGMAGMSAASLLGHTPAATVEVAGVLEIVDAAGPLLLPAGTPRKIGLLLFSDGVLCELDARVEDAADLCTAEDVAAGVAAAFDALTDPGPGPFAFGGASLEREIDVTVSALTFADRAAGFSFELGGEMYRVGHPPVWALFVEVVAAIAPLMVIAEGVEPVIQLGYLASLVNTGMAMVFSPVDVEALAAHLADDADPLDVIKVASVLTSALISLDTRRRQADARVEYVRDLRARQAVGGGEAGP